MSASQTQDHKQCHMLDQDEDVEDEDEIDEKDDNQNTLI